LAESVIHHYTFGPDKNYRDAWDEFERRRKERQQAAEKSAEVEDGNNEKEKTKDIQG